MTELSQKILESYQIRKTKKQKLAFIDLLREHYPDLQVQEGGLIKCRNVIIGDVENAKVVLTAHYDTCSALPFPNFITPKSPLFTILYTLLIVVPIFIAVLVLNMLLNYLSNNYWLHYFVSVTVYFGMLALLVLGPPNKHTANDNTSGVITLCELLNAMTEDARSKAAFVFFDHEETGLIGSYIFKKQYKAFMKDKLLINFDCVSDGDNLLLAATKTAMETYGTQFEESFVSTEQKTVLLDKLEKIYYPSDHAGFEVALAVAALKHKPVIGYYMDRIHTTRDTVFDESNIEMLCTGVRSFVEKL